MYVFQIVKVNNNEMKYSHQKFKKGLSNNEEKRGMLYAICPFLFQLSIRKVKYINIFYNQCHYH